MLNLGREHKTTVKRGLWYLRGTIGYGVCYQGKPGSEKQVQVRGFIDFDWVRDIDERRSTNGYVFNLNGGAVSWRVGGKKLLLCQLLRLNTWQLLM